MGDLPSTDITARATEDMIQSELDELYDYVSTTCARPPLSQTPGKSVLGAGSAYRPP